MPKKMYLQGILLYYFIRKKSPAETHRILVENYGDNCLSETTYRDYFRCFKDNDFDVEDKEHSRAPKKFEDKELEALLHEDLCKVQAEFAESLGVDHNSFKILERIRNDTKARTLDAVRVETKRCRTASCHMWKAASMAEKKRFFASYHDRQ